MGCWARFVVCLVAGLSAPFIAGGQPLEAQAILKARCLSCHGPQNAQSGLRVDARSALLEGGRGGPAIIPGKSAASLLIRRVTGEVPPLMPMGGKRMPEAEIDALRKWIDSGAEFAPGTEATIWRPSLKLERPAVPAGERPIDYLLDSWLRRNRIPAPPPVEDAVFARRAWFDLQGLPPSPDDLLAFEKSQEPDKRAKLVARLLADRKPFAEHWISFWNDLLHNDEGVNYIGDRKTITPYLLGALESNRRYDDFVRDLLNPEPEKGPVGFLIGVNWRGDISASQMPVMQAAQNSAQVFLGVNLKCNSCHDSFISRWKLKDAYGLASFFSEKPLELVRCDARTGEMSSPKFLYPELGSVSPDATLAERRAAAAELFTKGENGRFPRVFVNRVWKRLIGRGLVEPMDDLDTEPWSPEILDALAWDFVEHGYDIDWLLTEIMTSRAYQMPPVALGENEKNYVFRGPLFRRLTAEQFMDTVAALTGNWRVLATNKPGPGVYAREWRFKPSTLTMAMGRPLRDLAVTERVNDPTPLQMLELVNGQTLSELLRDGARRMLGEKPDPPVPLWDSGVVSAVPAAADIDISGVSKIRLMLVDHDSYDPTRVQAGWRDAVLEGPSGAVPLAQLAGVAQAPLQFRGETAGDAIPAKLPSEIVLDLAGRGFTRFRARAGVDASCLTSDIAPKIRFFVFDREPDPMAVTGVTGKPPVLNGPAHGGKEDEIARRVFRHALSRDPTKAELARARRILRTGKPAEGLEDLLWSLVLLPEFQYLR